MQSILEFLKNISIWSALIGWLLAQFIKLLRAYHRTGMIDLSCFVSTGGMPSAHTAMVSALAMSVGLVTGFDTPVFAVTLAFASIVMFDAQSVRRAAGMQARLLNQIIEELFKEHHLSQQKLAELLGHTRTEVFFGMGLGIATAFLVHAVAG